MNLTKIAYDRIAEPLSKGENIKKLLDLHISPYVNQVELSKTLEDLKSIDKTGGVFLEWFGVLKGILRPKTTLGIDLDQYFLTHDNTLDFDSNLLAPKPLYFGEKLYLSLNDQEFKTIIKAYCMLTGFRGRIEEYSYFFKEIFKIDIFIFSISNDLEFIIEDSRLLNIDFDLLQRLIPNLPATKNNFYISPYPLFVLDFPNIDGTKLDFGEAQSSSFYFSI